MVSIIALRHAPQGVVESGQTGMYVWREQAAVSYMRDLRAFFRLVYDAGLIVPLVHQDTAYLAKSWAVSGTR